MNCMITFGCAPSATVDARSTIAVDYFNTLERIKQRTNGFLYFPHIELTTWVTRIGGETLSAVTQELNIDTNNMP